MPPAAKHIFLLFLPAALAVLLGGCGALPESAETVAAREHLETNARRLKAGGGFAAAAGQYRSAADLARSPRRQELLLLAVDALLQGRAYDDAERLLAEIDAAELDRPVQLEHRLLQALLRLGRQEPGQARRLLAITPPADVPVQLRRKWRGALARSYQQSGDALKAVQERIMLDALLDSIESILANQEAILRSFTALSEDDLSRALAGAPPTLAGWIALARIYRALARDPDSAARVAEWRAAHIDHPAHSRLLEKLLAEARDMHSPAPRNLALLLPRSGPNAGYAEAVRDGLLAAYFAAGPADTAIRIYDSAQPESIQTLYRRVVDEGADFVVGPLAREAILRLTQIKQLPAPVLALNRVEPGAALPANLFLFALAPEDEAAQAAEFAWSAGHRNALALTAEDPLGGRALRRFQERWTELGGRLLEHQPYPSGDNDFSEQIERLLDIDASKGRLSALRRALNRNIRFQPRRRRDADMIFLLAQPRQARLIIPQLQFHGAADLPLYATSHVYTGAPEQGVDQDLDGLTFPDLPWVLAGGVGSAVSRAQIPNLWPQRPMDYLRLRLYAMGMDAFDLPSQLARMAHDPDIRHEGQTGILHVRDKHYIYRSLLWARFDQGEPVVIGYTPETEPQQMLVEPGADSVGQ